MTDPNERDRMNERVRREQDAIRRQRKASERDRIHVEQRDETSGLQDALEGLEIGGQITHVTEEGCVEFLDEKQYTQVHESFSELAEADYNDEEGH